MAEEPVSSTQAAPLRGSAALWVLTLSAATLATLSFPNPIDFSLHPWGAPLAWIALAPFFLAVEGFRPARSARWGFLFGFMMFGAIVYWIALLQEAENLRVWGWVALSAIEGLYIALFGWGLSLLRPGRGLAGSLQTAALWTGIEFFRGNWPFGGFPWGQIGYAHASSPSLLYWTSFTGIWGLTFASALLAREAAQAWRFRRETENRHRVARIAAILLLLYGVGTVCRWKPTPGAQQMRVACLQPDVDQSVKWSKSFENETFRLMEGLTGTAAALNPGLVIWPETASPNYLLWDAPALRKVVGMVKASGKPAFVGCLDAVRSPGGKTRQYNAAVAFSAAGAPIGTYHKIHLVPFGEYVPYQKYLAFLGPVVGDLGNFDRGQGPLLFSADGFTYTPLICYEAVFPSDVRQAANTGADLLVNISNDAWYGRTAALYQHALMCSAQAAAVRRPMARASNPGISFLADASGRILAASAWWKEETLVGAVPAAEGRTLYDRWGDWFPWTCILVSFLGLLVTVLRRHP